MIESIVRKLEIAALYVVLMGVGFLFDPPLLYTNYPYEVGLLFAVVMLYDIHTDLIRMNQWVKSFLLLPD